MHPFLLVLSVWPCLVRAQIATGQSDRTQQEIAMLGWTAGVETAYCQEVPVPDLVDPFRDAISRMLNRHCRSPAVCGLRSSVSFSRHQVVLLEGYPRREHRTVHFRFFVVFPHNAVPKEKKPPEKPMLSSAILSDMLDAQITELSRGLGWQVLSFEQYPHFDPTTTFFNKWLIPITFVVAMCMVFLAYWTTAYTSGSSLYAGGWFVKGSSGGKNAALRRTMEIIEEQKYRFALYECQRANDLPQPPVEVEKTVLVYRNKDRRVKDVQAPVKSLATSYTAPQVVRSNRASPLMFKSGLDSDRQQKQKNGRLQSGKRPAQGESIPLAELGSDARRLNASPKPEVSASREDSIRRRAAAAREFENELEEMADAVPEIVVVHAQSSSSAESHDTMTSETRRAALTNRRQSRRISDDLKRKKLLAGMRKTRVSQPERQERWKASSLALSKFSSVGLRK